MSDPHARPDFEPDPDAVARRDGGLRRVSNATRWSFAAAAAGTAVLGVTYLHLIPGTSSAPSAPVAAQPGQPVSAWTCTTTTALTPAPASVPQTTTTCVTRPGGPGPAAPGQPPATAQAPHTRTGAS